jgi:hypothetical protein
MMPTLRQFNLDSQMKSGLNIKASVLIRVSHHMVTYESILKIILRIMKKVYERTIRLFKMVDIWLLLVDVEYQKEEKVVPKSPEVVKKIKERI